MITPSFHLYVRSSRNIHTVYFIPFTGTMNSANWPAPNVWVFIAQLLEHCSANTEAMGSNPVEAPKTFFGLNCDCLNRNHKCDDHTFISLSLPSPSALLGLSLKYLFGTLRFVFVSGLFLRLRLGYCLCLLPNCGG